MADCRMPFVNLLFERLNRPLCKGNENCGVLHSALMSNQTKVRKTKTGPLQGEKAWSRDPKSAFFDNKEHFY